MFMCLAGCGPSTPVAPTAPVSGVVTLDGTPVEHAVITFIPIDGTGGFGAAATTDAAGRYVVRTPVKTSGLTGQRVVLTGGLPPGRYRVQVSRRLHPDGSPLRPDETPIESPAVETIARTFSDATATTLVAEVPAAGGMFDWRVTGVKARR
jgi:hypothetical protein